MKEFLKAFGIIIAGTIIFFLILPWIFKIMFAYECWVMNF